MRTDPVDPIANARGPLNVHLLEGRLAVRSGLLLCRSFQELIEDEIRLNGVRLSRLVNPEDIAIVISDDKTIPIERDRG